MGKEEVLSRLRDAVVNLDVEGVRRAAEDALSAGVPPVEAISLGMARGMDVVGEKYESKEYFLSELIMAGEVMKEGINVLEPHMDRSGSQAVGRVVIGTVRGDLHDIGKNVVTMLLRAAGFDVTDLGTDVPADDFVKAVRERRPHIVAASSLLTTTMTEMKGIVEQLEKAGLRKSVKVIIGGAPVTPEYAEKIGADAAAKDAVDGVNKCKAWIAG